MARAISADSHAVESPEVFTGLAERFGEEAPRVISTPGEGDSIVIPARKNSAVNVAQMCLASLRLDLEVPVDRRHAHKPDAGNLTDPTVKALYAGGYAVMREGITQGASRGDDQDIDGIAAEFLYPGYFPMFNLRNVDLLVALQKNYNDWLHDHCADSAGRLFGLAVLPMQDPDAAMEELDRILAMGFRGACIPSTAPADHPYYDSIFDPLWAKAAEAELPLSMHVGCFSYVPKEKRDGRRRDPIAQYAGSAAMIQDTLIEFICRGVCERHPTLQLVVAEYNAGWIAHWLDRVDQGWQREVGRKANGPAHLPVHEIWRRQFYATIEDDQPALMTRSILGEDRLMWGSDYPHTDSTWPCSEAVLTEMFADYPVGTREKITRGNVQRLYKLD